MSEIEGTAESQLEMVPVDQATDDDLRAFLSGFSAQKEEEETPPISPDKDIPDGNKAPEDQEEATKNGNSKKGQNLSDEATAQAKIEQLRAALAKQTMFAQQRSTEIGELRKQIREVTNQLAHGLQDEFIENPEKAVDKKLQIKANENMLSQLDQEEQEIQRREATAKIVASHLRPDEYDTEAIAASLERDGASPQFIQSFLADPYSKGDGVTLVQLAKRASAEKALVNVVRYAKQLELKIQELGKKPNEVLKNIQQATRIKPLTAASGGTSRSSYQTSISDINQLTKMSSAELEELLKQSN